MTCPFCKSQTNVEVVPEDIFNEIKEALKGERLPFLCYACGEMFSFGTLDDSTRVLEEGEFNSFLASEAYTKLLLPIQKKIKAKRTQAFLTEDFNSAILKQAIAQVEQVILETPFCEDGTCIHCRIGYKYRETSKRMKDAVNLYGISEIAVSHLVTVGIRIGFKYHEIIERLRRDNAKSRSANDTVSIDGEKKQVHNAPKFSSDV